LQASRAKECLWFYSLRVQKRDQEYTVLRGKKKKEPTKKKKPESSVFKKKKTYTRKKEKENKSAVLETQDEDRDLREFWKKGCPQIKKKDPIWGETAKKMIGLVCGWGAARQKKGGSLGKSGREKNMWGTHAGARG